MLGREDLATNATPEKSENNNKIKMS